MRLLKCILTENPCYKTAGTMVPKGVMVHSTGANNPYIERYVEPLDYDVPGAYDPDRETLKELFGPNPYNNDWNHSFHDACVHAFIGKLADGTVATAQTLPWNHFGWHAGLGWTGKSANATHISYEICEDDLTDPVYFRAAIKEAVELTAMLCKTYNLDPFEDGVIICHQDGYQRGVACNHGDIYNWWPKYNYTMDDFRAAVKAEMDKEDDDMVYYKTIEDVPSAYKDSIQKAIDSGALKGSGNGNINVSEDMCRILTVLDRMGKL